MDTNRAERNGAGGGRMRSVEIDFMEGRSISSHCKVSDVVR